MGKILKLGFVGGGINSTIGAGSVITKNVPSNSLAIERTEQKNFIKK